MFFFMSARRGADAGILGEQLRLVKELPFFTTIFYKQNAV
ncbi:hypothetical protein NEILACOT_03137 [Neisseria lactamica ATCC 23970]|uniref:Uncharacterized protein n=1 Tax=Neisseria lactamica ATCC 23970 TaxID=546265 RepID=D0W6J9_NEILA|nr:hypothetical protein NEILACOT_03137 [Neisseria lactamica ATCC 23970]